MGAMKVSVVTLNHSPGSASLWLAAGWSLGVSSYEC